MLGLPKTPILYSTRIHIMVKKLLILGIFLLPSQLALAEELPTRDWALYEILRSCGNDYKCFEQSVDYKSGPGLFSVIGRAARLDKVAPARIKRIKQGRNYKSGLYYTTFEETHRTRKGGYYCDMKVYYNPKTMRIENINLSGDCAEENIPDMGGFQFSPGSTKE